jgi:hypothetical protein
MWTLKGARSCLEKQGWRGPWQWKVKERAASGILSKTALLISDHMSSSRPQVNTCVGQDVEPLLGEVELEKEYGMLTIV